MSCLKTLTRARKCARERQAEAYFGLTRGERESMPSSRSGATNCAGRTGAAEEGEGGREVGVRAGLGRGSRARQLTGWRTAHPL